MGNFTSNIFIAFQHLSEGFCFHFPLVPNMFLSSSQWVPIRLIVNMFGGNDFFHFSLVPSVFSLCSPCVPNGFPSGPQFVPQHVVHSTSLVSHMLWQMLSSFHLYRWATGEELYTSKWNLLFWGAWVVSFFLSDEPIKLARCKRKKLKLGGTSSN